MAVNEWRGDAPNVAQVVTLTVGSHASTETFITTMNGKSVTYAAGTGETDDTVAAAIQSLLASCNIPEFNEVTWTVDAAVVTGTASVPGVPFTVSVGGTGTYTLNTVTPSTGNSQVDEPLNWTLGTVPDAGDDVLIDSGADLLYFGTLSAAAYASFRVKASFQGNIGLPYRNPNGYVEYRPRYYPIDTAVPCTIGEGIGTGPTRVFLSMGSVMSLSVLLTGVRQTGNVPVVNIYGFSSGALNVVAGDVGIAADLDSQTGTATTAVLNNPATVTVGTNGVITTCTQDGATLTSFGTITTLNNSSGTTTLYKAPTTITGDGGNMIGMFTGTVTTLTLRGQGNPQTDPRLDFSQDSRSRTITNGSITGGAWLNDPDKTSTWSNPFTMDAAWLELSTLGNRFTILRA